ncbi:hypothetical protein N9P17_07795 [Tateyamaria sp.]|nr:hypothetical protein [Tateyamaria sp.]
MKTLFLIVGTGQSGTSLTMQVLEKLGLSTDQEGFLPSQNNLAGTGGSIFVRDMMRSLTKATEVHSSFRPSGWESFPEVNDNAKLLTNYLLDQAANAGEQGFALKFPLASIFLPLWVRVAGDAKVKLRLIWSTRRASDTLNSLMNSYGTDLASKHLTYMQRVYYLLRDAAGDTILLPYEGWIENPSKQVAFLADMIGVNDPLKMANAQAVFTETLNRSSNSAAVPVPAPVVALDDKIYGKICRLDEVFQRDSLEYLQLMTALADEIVEPKSKRPVGYGEEAYEMRLRFISKLASISSKACPTMTKQIKLLEKQFKNVKTEHFNMKLSLANYCRERKDTSDLLKGAKAAYYRLSSECDTMEERIENRMQWRYQQAEVNSQAKINNLSKQIDDLNNGNKALRDRIEQLKSSRSWKVTAPVRWLVRIVRRLTRVE